MTERLWELPLKYPKHYEFQKSLLFFSNCPNHGSLDLMIPDLYCIRYRFGNTTGTAQVWWCTGSSTVWSCGTCFRTHNSGESNIYVRAQILQHLVCLERLQITIQRYRSIGLVCKKIIYYERNREKNVLNIRTVCNIRQQYRESSGRWQEKWLICRHELYQQDRVHE